VVLFSPAVRRVLASRIMQKLLYHFLQNLVERWHVHVHLMVSSAQQKKPFDSDGNLDHVMLGLAAG